MILLAAAVMAWCGAAQAAESAPPSSGQGLQNELNQAKREIADLRAKYEALVQRLDQNEQRAAHSATSDELIRLVGGLSSEGTKNITWQSKFNNIKIDLYGYVKADAAWDSARTSDPNQPAFVLPERLPPFSGARNDDEFALTVMQTRLGLRIWAPDKVLGARVSGTIEFDFYGTLAPENKARLMLRRAVIDMIWDERCTIGGQKFAAYAKAGQDWELFSPLAPTVLNYPYLALAGNPGYRRPLVIVGTSTDVDGLRMELAGSVVRVMGELGQFSTGLVKGATLSTGLDTGSDSGWPALQGRFGLSYPMDKSDPGNKRRYSIGLTGVYGEEEVDNAAPLLGDREFRTWGLCLDAEVPVYASSTCDLVSQVWGTGDFAVVLKGEVWHGENMDEWLGGIGQGINLMNGNGNTIEATGGWAQASFQFGGAKNGTQLNFGLGFDDPKNHDLRNIPVKSLPRSENLTVFGNVIQSLSEQLKVGFEVQYIRTDYMLLDAADAMRYMASVIFEY
jgi:hypothetical protein